MTTKKIGLIVNPLAGIGGRVGLKGSDGVEIQKKALALGAIPESQGRVVLALKCLKPVENDLALVTYPGEMGEEASNQSGLNPIVIGAIEHGQTVAEDTSRAALEMLDLGIDLLLFAGGDGTARDIYNAIGDQLPVVGIPTGVKIHSAVYARNPVSAGELALSYLQGQNKCLREVEVVDIDEDAYRCGTVSTRLYGYLKVPYQRRLLQGLKSGSVTGERASQIAIAAEIVDNMHENVLYIIGPGTTTRAITSRLGLEKTLLGVDVLLNRNLIATDVNEAQLLALLPGHRAKIIITPIGGQGFLFGRGNQQISPEVVRRVGINNIIVVSTAEKVNSLGGRPFLVDTGNYELDNTLIGYIEVITGYRESLIYKIAC